MSTRSQEVAALLNPVTSRLVDFLANADAESDLHKNEIFQSSTPSALINHESLVPEKLITALKTSLEISAQGTGKKGLLNLLDHILRYSVNTTCSGFMDKLYGSPLPPGIAAELILSVLNTNVHVYQVSPVLTLVEKRVTKALATMFGLNEPRAGGISVQGGSASNMTSIVAARNSLFPQTKVHGNASQNAGRLILFTSAHGHYSVEKAAQALGFGSKNVVPVPVDSTGSMVVTELDRLIEASKSNGDSPFYINATAGTTVLGSFDPFGEIAMVARKHRCWLHVDGAWGGSFVFARRSDITDRLKGIGRADSIAINPHKMLGVPMTCSFLLTRDLKLFQSAMTLKAGYLFHDAEEDDIDGRHTINADTTKNDDLDELTINGSAAEEAAPFDRSTEDGPWEEPLDLADLTLQCGRRGDSLKFFLSWQYYGTDGYRAKVEQAYDIAVELAQLVDSMQDLTLVLEQGSRPACLQVCFYYIPSGMFLFGSAGQHGHLCAPGLDNTSAETDSGLRQTGKYNSLLTSKISRALIGRGFMIDFAPALEGQEDRGSFFRVVVNISTSRETTKRLIRELLDVGGHVVEDMRRRYGSKT